MKKLIVLLISICAASNVFAETRVDIEYANDGTIPTSVGILNASAGFNNVYLLSRDPKLPKTFFPAKEKRIRNVKSIYSVNPIMTANLKSFDDKIQGYLMAKYCDMQASEVDLGLADPSAVNGSIDTWMTIKTEKPLKPKSIEVSSDLNEDGKIDSDKEYKTIPCP